MNSCCIEYPSTNTNYGTGFRCKLLTVIDLSNATTPCLVAEYTGEYGAGIKPVTN